MEIKPLEESMAEKGKTEGHGVISPLSAAAILGAWWGGRESPESARSPEAQLA